MKKPSYSSKMSFIRPFVSFDFKNPERLARSNKSMLTKYYNYLQKNKDNYVAIPPPRGNFEEIQRQINPTFRSIPKKFKKTKFKVLFLPSDEWGGVKIIRRGKRWVVKRGTIERSTLEFEDKDYLVTDPEGYVNSLVRRFSKKTFFRLFNPQDWRDEAFDKGSIAKAVADFFLVVYKDAVNSAEKHSWGLIVEKRGA